MALYANWMTGKQNRNPTKSWNRESVAIVILLKIQFKFSHMYIHLLEVEDKLATQDHDQDQGN